MAQETPLYPDVFNDRLFNIACQLVKDPVPNIRMTIARCFSLVLSKQYTKIARQQSDVSASRSLRKQFSIDHSLKIDTAPAAVGVTNLKLPTISTIPATPTKALSAIVSSSTSTDESKDERDIPTISTNYVTNVVQDEIAKLSSNISRSTDERDGAPSAGGCSSDQSVNETMC